MGQPPTKPIPRLASQPGQGASASAFPPKPGCEQHTRGYRKAGNERRPSGYLGGENAD